jgi:murein DD-endopeptidase MepM/ murein hydrolase activator NlpD
VVSARLTAGGYVFPVYGPASFGDTFGDPRGDLESGWHHGADIFAPLGTPLLAVADGTVFSVGWNRLGGWRLWLRDHEGNEFYYAHLSAYSPLAVNGRQVKAGDVLGFMGKTGDARNSAVHLHFEIHPVGMLSLGYDGVVAPYAFLVSWRRAQDVAFSAGRVYLPFDGPGSSVGVAPPVGAVLLEADDISSASGLVPGALEQALSGRAPTGTRPTQDR